MRRKVVCEALRGGIIATVLAWAGALRAMAQDAPGTQPARPPGPRLQLAVAGFTVDAGTDPRDTWLGTGLEEVLSWRLRRVPGLTVVPTIRLNQAQRELQDDDQPPPAWPRVARALGAELLLTGTCRGTPDQLVAELTLLELSDPPRPRSTVTLPPGRLFATADAATRWSLTALAQPPLPPALERLIFAEPARSPSAVEYYARALSAARAAQWHDAGYYGQRALEYDGRYRPALALLAQLDLQAGPAGYVNAATRLRVLSELAQYAGDPLDWAAAELGQGVLLQLADAFDAAYLRLEAALALACELDSPYGQIAALNSLGDLYITRRWPAAASPGEHEQQQFEQQNLRHAAQWQEIGLALLRDLDDAVAEAPAANKLALIHERLGEAEAALALHQRSLAAAQRCGSRRNQASAWLALAQAYNRAQRWDEALAAANRCLELAAESDRPAVWVTLAAVHQGRRQPAQALPPLEQAYAALRSRPDTLPQQFRLAAQVADLRMELGQAAAARSALQEALDIAHALGLPQEAELRAKLEAWQRQ